MSLMGTLAKIAVGMAVAKGVKSLTGGGGRGSSGGGLGDLLGQLTGASGGRQTQSSGGLGDLLGQLTGSGSSSASGGTGLENIMGSVFKNAQNQSGSGGLGGLGGMLDSLSGSGARAGTGAGGIGDMLNQSFDRFGEPEATPTPEQDETAGVMLKAMLQAAKSDGRIDAKE